MEKFSFVMLYQSAGHRKIRPMEATDWVAAKLEAAKQGGQPARLVGIVDRYEFAKGWVTVETRVEIALSATGYVEAVLYIDAADIPNPLYNVEDRTDPATGHAMSIPAAARLLQRINDALKAADAETSRRFVSALWGDAMAADYKPVTLFIDPANPASANAAIVLHGVAYGDTLVEYASMRAVYVAAVESGLLKGGES